MQRVFIYCFIFLVSPALAQETVNDLSPWNGRHITMSLSSDTFSAEVMEPVFAAIAEASPELSRAQVEATYAEMSRTDFDSFNVAGRLVTFETATGPVACRYSYVRSEPLADFPESDWHLFEAGTACRDYRYLALGVPHASEPGSSPHFHFRYGDESFEAITQGEEVANWYPSAYPETTPVDSILTGYTENAAALGTFLASTLGVVADNTGESEREAGADETSGETEAVATPPDTASGADDLEGSRLLVSDAESTNVHVLDASSGEVIASFATPGMAGRVYPSPNGRFGFVIHRDEDRVSLVHSGLTTVDHVDHVDLVQGAPYVSATMNVGREPTHFFAHDNDIAFFNDEDGTVALLDQRLLGLSLDYAQVTVAQPDHGAPILHGDHMLSGYYDLGRVDIYERSGALVQTIEDCAGLHGAAHSGDLIAYGCEDGLLLIRAEDGTFDATKLPNPADTPEDVRVGTLAAHDDSEVMVGNFGAGVTMIDSTTETLTPIELGANPLRMTFADGETLVVLTVDGQLHLLDAASGDVRGSVQVLDAPDLEVEGAVRPTFVLRGGVAFVSDPAGQQLHQVALADLSVQRSLPLDFTPYTLASLAIPGATVHD